MASREDSPQRKAELARIHAAFIEWQKDNASPEQADLWGRELLRYANLAVAHRASGLQALGVDIEDAQAEVVAGLLKSLKTVKLRENNPRCLVGLICFACRNLVITIWKSAKSKAKSLALREADAPEDFVHHLRGPGTPAPDIATGIRAMMDKAKPGVVGAVPSKAASIAWDLITTEVAGGRGIPNHAEMTTLAHRAGKQNNTGVERYALLAVCAGVLVEQFIDDRAALMPD